MCSNNTRSRLFCRIVKRSSNGKTIRDFVSEVFLPDLASEYKIQCPVGSFNKEMNGLCHFDV